MEPPRVHITAYGCQMNQLDAEVLAQRLRDAGATVVADPAAADVLLFVTCAVREHAENRVFSNIGALGPRKRRQPGLVIGLLGCMAQQYGEAVRRRAPLVDIVCAPGRLAELPALIDAARAARPAVALDPPRGPAGGPAAFAALDAALDAAEAARPLGGPSPGHAYVAVMRGCDNFCAYCVVPHVRGPERSRPPAAVLDEVRRLAAQGARQITFLGQAVNQYAAREAGRAWDLADLLAATAAAAPGLARLGFITSHPRAMTPRLARVFGDVPRVVPYLHMPAQSGADAVLARMNRGYTAAEYADRVALVRAARPEVAVASDFIVGFPGETAADLEATLGLVRQVRFSAAFVFKYSPRPGTAAAGWSDDVPAAEKARRHKALLDLVHEIAAEENRRLVGRRVAVFVEGPSPRPNLDAAHRLSRGGCESPRGGSPPGATGGIIGRGGSPHPPRTNQAAARPGWVQLRGRTPCNRIAVFDGPPDLAGSEVEVTVTDASPLTLFASLPPDVPGLV
ncbi:MAG: tRNA (N6-isopentenyl adenosine(37)-C2)-methylthiotransferase MiaB [Planctomycetes bacterium]|nr:tRNA (N6-isopentenyl adenosine(37)-C2)-methylthiotransferase MiaB [Planctomycetota bacterium]